MSAEWIVLTGMSGAGKSNALHQMEDLGFTCIDNLPPQLLPQLAELRRDAPEPTTVVMDARSRDGLDAVWAALERLKAGGTAYRILFLDADDAELIRRYRETRRAHPLAEPTDSSIEQAIQRERERLAPLFERADYRIDTTKLLPAQLRNQLTALLFTPRARSSMWVHCVSFGFKYGVPADADVVFDVRCLPNPFYIAELKPLTGLDESVERYVMSFESSRKLMDGLKTLLGQYVPLFADEGRAQLTIAIGCTGGKHRSVVFAKELGEFLEHNGQTVSVSHRDAEH
ncbi:nucleotide-binding protein [Clostridia bacterium]|nr:nucleotide-binding protein [Clostridia bacterium]